MTFHFIVAAVLAGMLAFALGTWLRMGRYARLLKRSPAELVTTEATITGIGGPFGSMQYRFRFNNESGVSRSGRFYVTTRQLRHLPIPGNLAKGGSIKVTYARRDPGCVYIEPCRDYYLSYLTRGQVFMVVFMVPVLAGLVAQAVRIIG